MTNSDLDTVRRVLKGALDKLDGELPGDKESSIPMLLSEKDAGAPVVLVLVGGLNAQDQDAPPLLVAATTGGRETEKSSVAGPHRTEDAKASHPGLDRFPLAVTSSLSTAPKACFMEPGRTCVNSGACEMRGF